MNLGADLTGGLFASDGRRALSLRKLSVADLGAPTLNPLLVSGRAVWTEVHAEIEEAFRTFDDDQFVDPASLNLRLPFEVADYVDFY